MGDLLLASRPRRRTRRSIRPRNMTRIRSASPSSSGSSDEIISTPAPAVGHVLDQPVDLALGADVDAARRLAEHDHRRATSANQRPRTTFCWLPPERWTIGVAQRRRLDAEALDRVARHAALVGDVRSRPRRREPRRPTRPRGCAGPSASGGSRCACGPRGRTRCPPAIAARGERRRTARPVHRDLAVGGHGAAERERELALAAADEARDADDLARAHLEATRRCTVPSSRRQARHREHRRRRARASRLLKRSVISRPTIIRTSAALVVSGSGAVPIRRPSRRTVTREQQRYISRRRCEMNTIATPALAQLLEALEQALGRGLGERARRLVEDEHARVGGDRARDLDLLLQLDRERADASRGSRRARRASSSASVARRCARRQSIEPRLRGSRPIRMFSATVSVGASVSSWLIATMPCSIAARGPAKRDRLAVDLDRAGVGLEGAVEDLHERRLARAVLAREARGSRPRSARSRRRRAPARSANALRMPVIRTRRRASQDAACELDGREREAPAGDDVRLDGRGRATRRRPRRSPRRSRCARRSRPRRRSTAGRGSRDRRAGARSAAGTSPR